MKCAESSNASGPTCFQSFRRLRSDFERGGWPRPVMIYYVALPWNQLRCRQLGTWQAFWFPATTRRALAGVAA
jgi:hypothetical protein